MVFSDLSMIFSFYLSIEFRASSELSVFNQIICCNRHLPDYATTCFSLSSSFVADFPTPVSIQSTLHGLTVSVIPGTLGTADLPSTPDLVGESGLSDVSTVPGLSGVPGITGAPGAV